MSSLVVINVKISPVFFLTGQNLACARHILQILTCNGVISNRFVFLTIQRHILIEAVLICGYSRTCELFIVYFSSWPGRFLCLYVRQHCQVVSHHSSENNGLLHRCFTFWNIIFHFSLPNACQCFLFYLKTAICSSWKDLACALPLDVSVGPQSG